MKMNSLPNKCPFLQRTK